MRILAINISHHASIAQITDGVLDLYFEEDRFNKVKQAPPEKFPERRFISIDKHITEKPDYVIFASGQRYTPLIKIIPNVVHNFDIISWIVKQLEDKFGEIKTYFIKEHHLYHAHSAFYFSKLNDAICVVMDGGGAPYHSNEQYVEIESIYDMDKTKCVAKYKSYTNVDITLDRMMLGIPKENLFYTFNEDSVEIELSSKYSSGMKFQQFAMDNNTGIEIGKIMGLASYGNLTGDRLEDKARQLQEETVLDTFEIIDKAITYSNSKNIILSGGYALNCVNNYEYVKEFPDYNFFVDPAAHDGGTAIGAGIWLWRNLNDNKR
jgi:carbamoyltransferase